MPEEWFDGIQKIRRMTRTRKSSNSERSSAIRRQARSRRSSIPLSISWEQEQERKRREEQNRLAEEARKQAEEEQRLQTAIEMEKQGAPKEAVEAVISAPVAVYSAPSSLHRPTRNRAQVVYRDSWSGECDDLYTL
jgi:membrane protein involved in colicin uptake